MEHTNGSQGQGNVHLCPGLHGWCVFYFEGQECESTGSETQLSRGTIDSGGVCEAMVWKWVLDMGMSPAPKWL